jgi:hypothetical protein
MTHPDLDNRTPLAFAPLFTVGPSGRPLLVCIAKASFEILESGRLILAEEQLPVSFGGSCRGDPATASYKYEPETAWTKPHTDVVLVAHAWATSARCSVLDVGFRVGPVQQTARVFGDRVWHAGGMTPARPFERVPLTYERAFGGADPTMQLGEKLACAPENPLGRGFYRRGKPSSEDALPNIEDPRRPITSHRDCPGPVGFGFTSPSFQPRAAHGGTYDQRWLETRSPFLPADFDARYFNAAPPALIARQRLVGNEPVVLRHVASRPVLSFALAGTFRPTCRVHLGRSTTVMLALELDTIIVNTDDALVLMLWRAAIDLRHGPLDVRALQLTVEGLARTSAREGRLAGVPACAA